MSPRPQLEEGIALQRRGRFHEAAALYRAVLDQCPDDARALHYLGLVNSQLGKLEDADAQMTRSLAIDPTCANSCNDLGVVKLKACKHDEAIRLFSRALALDEKHTDALNNMAVGLKQLHQFDRALVALRRLANLLPESPRVLCELADTLYKVGNVAEAVRIYYEAIAIDPGNKAARLGLAEACESIGKFKQARMHYVAVVRRDADSSLALSRLLQSRAGEVDAKWIQRAQELAEDPATASVAKTRLHIGLAHYYDSVGGYDTAFRHLKLGNDAQARRRPFDNNGYSRAIDALIETLTEGFFRSARPSGISTSRPIFIVGMPRSGTTLTEQILASHSKVAAGGELAAIPQATYQVRRFSASRKPYPHGLTDVTAEGLATLARQYLDHLETISPDASRVTDKLPFNFMHLAMIALLFPNSRVIHCRRSPLDNCLSCYFASFAEENNFANDLAGLGRYYLDYHRLMVHWKAVLPLRIHDVQYEDLVCNTEAAIRGLLEFCELDWEDACCNFHETRREIRTPSRWQVRQPIYASSVGRWRHYQAQLEPLKESLAPLAAQP
jgi:tetratricopeptide (TPR) repeat protein